MKLKVKIIQFISYGDSLIKDILYLYAYVYSHFKTTKFTDIQTIHSNKLKYKVGKYKLYVHAK